MRKKQYIIRENQRLAYKRPEMELIGSADSCLLLAGSLDESNNLSGVVTDENGEDIPGGVFDSGDPEEGSNEAE